MKKVTIRLWVALLALGMLAACAAPRQAEQTQGPILLAQEEIEKQVAALVTKEGFVRGVQSWQLHRANPYAVLSDTYHALLCMEQVGGANGPAVDLTGRAIERLSLEEVVVWEEGALACLRLYDQIAALAGAQTDAAATRSLARSLVRERGYLSGEKELPADVIPLLNDLHDAALLLQDELTEEERRVYAGFVQQALEQRLNKPLAKDFSVREEMEEEIGILWLCGEILRISQATELVDEALLVRSSEKVRGMWEEMLKRWAASNAAQPAADGGMDSAAQQSGMALPADFAFVSDAADSARPGDAARQGLPVDRLSTLVFVCSLWDDALTQRQVGELLAVFEREEGYSFFAQGEPHLMGTYDALQTRRMAGLALSKEERAETLQFVRRFQTPDGFYCAFILEENACFSWQARQLLALAGCDALPDVELAALAPYEARMREGEVSEETMAAYRLSNGALGGQDFLERVFESLSRIVDEGMRIPFYHFVSAVEFLHDASYAFPQEFCSAYDQWYAALEREIVAQGSQADRLTFAGMDVLARRYLGEEASKEELACLKDGLCSALPDADEPLFFAAVLCQALEGEREMLLAIRESCGALLLERAEAVRAGSFFSISADTPVNFEDSVLVLRLLLTLELGETT